MKRKLWKKLYISLSIGENYNVDEVIFMLNDEEITKSVIKALE